VVPGGNAYVLRPLRADDEDRLLDFFKSHSQETVQARYGYMIGAMTHERAHDLVNVDQRRDVALGIFEDRGPEEILHAVGRYYTEENGGTAEVAFVVRESMRNRGFATTLLRHLALAARERGLGGFSAQVLRDNRAMRCVFDRFAPAVRPVSGSDSVKYVFSVASVLAKNAPISSISAERKAPRGA
jgi:RimJ/RimL family protein N-acetyltransferase